MWCARIDFESRKRAVSERVRFTAVDADMKISR
jgi:hypothetical protein